MKLFDQFSIQPKALQYHKPDNKATYFIHLLQFKSQNRQQLMNIFYPFPILVFRYQINENSHDNFF